MKLVVFFVVTLFSSVHQNSLHPYLGYFTRPLSVNDLKVLLGEEYSTNPGYRDMTYQGNGLEIKFYKKDVEKSPMNADLKFMRINQKLFSSKNYQQNPIFGLTTKMDAEMVLAHLQYQPGIEKLKDSGDFGGRNIIFNYNIRTSSGIRRLKFYIRVVKGKKKKYWIDFINISDYYYTS
jgi:hypothetical protein